MKEYLIDESIFVYLDRNEYKLIGKLILFLEGGRVAGFWRHLIKEPKNKREHKFYMPLCSKVRLKNYLLLKIILKWKKIFGAPNKETEPLEKAKHRTEICKAYIEGYRQLGIIGYLVNRFCPRELSNLFVYANEAKSKQLQRDKKRKIKANEIIPISTCEVAMIARKYKLEIVSFNRDYKYFRMLPNYPNPYIKYHHPDDLLKNK